MGFLNRLKETLSDEKYGKESDKLTYKTGISALDFLGAKTYANPNAPGGQEIVFGLYHPGLIGFIGKSGTAKSSIMLQTTWEVCQRYEDSSIIWLDFENSLNRQRIAAFTGIVDKDDPKFDYRNTGISIESTFNLLMDLRDEKVAYYKNPENLVENKEGIVDPKTGELLRIMPPTFVCIDSVRAMTSSKLRLEDPKTSEMAQNNMYAAQIALKLGQLARQSMQLCAEANIIVVYVNHIQQDINTGFTPKPKYLNFLKQGETLGGGDQWTYYTGTMIKLIAKGNLEPDNTAGNPFKLKGFDLEAFLVKSRETAAGQGTSLSFDQNNGFDNDYCLYTILEENKVITAAGAYKKLAGYAKNWRAGDLKELLSTDKEFSEIFYTKAKDLLESMVYVPTKHLNDDGDIVRTIDEPTVANPPTEVLLESTDPIE